MNEILTVRLSDSLAEAETKSGHKLDGWLPVLAFAPGCSLGEDSRWLLGVTVNLSDVEPVGWFNYESFKVVRKI